MFDACVLYNISPDEKRQFHIHTGSAKIADDLKFQKNDIVFLSPKTDDVLDKGLKMGLPSGVINAELLYPKDSLQHVKGGIDDSAANFMFEKKIALVFNLNLLLTSEHSKRGRIIRRMAENMKRAVKYDLPVLFASCAKDKYELFNGSEIKAWANYLGIDNFERVRVSFEKLFK
ncbi:Ribonuclease P protein component 3 [Candidatus Tiddalikarchaeum anstoanum]|nr:Ribonuclease P protein component 3 [Candidatus Tiddalikarchaeum anstoanum]